MRQIRVSGKAFRIYERIAEGIPDFAGIKFQVEPDEPVGMQFGSEMKFPQFRMLHHGVCIPNSVSYPTFSFYSLATSTSLAIL